jgi:hypothetical protein
MKRKSPIPSVEEIRLVVKNIELVEDGYESLRSKGYPTEETAHELICCYRQFFAMSGYFSRVLGKSGGNKSEAPRRSRGDSKYVKWREDAAIAAIKKYPRKLSLRAIQVRLDSEKTPLHFSLQKIAELRKKCSR